MSNLLCIFATNGMAIGLQTYFYDLIGEKTHEL
jgi:hypothetical protein